MKLIRCGCVKDRETHPGLWPPLQRRGFEKIPSFGGVPERRGGLRHLTREVLQDIRRLRILPDTEFFIPAHYASSLRSFCFDLR
jgi:hypothetical protein